MANPETIEAPDQSAALRLWDLPVRIVHWSFVLLLPALWWTAEEHDLEMHNRLGLVMIGLVVFRVIWGFVGSSTARFGAFLKGPRAILAYLRGAAEPVVGHNPLGGLSVIALLGLLLLQAALGTVAQDVDGLESGPLSYLVEYETADAAREWHELLFNVILCLVALHVAAVAYYLIAKHDNLVRPMLTGRRRYDSAVSEPRIAPHWIGLVCALAAGAFSYWIALGAPVPG